ncbi:MAG: twin-arginine translocase subunit TatC [Jatrophihabitans sp.]|nr:MAG: twin-arginine translocase subunit TatC [Jatrophihabitans sp.]
MKRVPRRLRRRRSNPDARMSVMDHLRELRRRLITILLIVVAGAVLGWIFYDPVIHFLEEPYCSVPAQHRFTGTGQKCALIYNGVLAGFTTRLKVAVIAGAVVTGPLWLYQIWAFITPGLRRNERKYTLWFVAVSTILFAGGMTLAYLVLSKGLNVLLGQAGTGVQALLTVDSYLSFVTLMLLMFGAAFELPLLVVMANLAGVLSARILRKSQRLAIFLIFVFAAVATPSTDPFTMCAMALPMVALFEAAVLFATVHDRRKARRQAAERALPHPEDDVPSELSPFAEPDEPWAGVT